MSGIELRGSARPPRSVDVSCLWDPGKAVINTMALEAQSQAPCSEASTSSGLRPSKADLQQTISSEVKHSPNTRSSLRFTKAICPPQFLGAASTRAMDQKGEAAPQQVHLATPSALVQLPALMQQCFVCLSTNLSVDNGVLLCDDCGTQNQAQVEEAEEGDVGGLGASRRRAAGSLPATPRLFRQSTPEATAQDVEEQLRQQAVAYLQCLTTLVRAQSEALVARFGVVAEVEGLVRRLWFQLLPHTGFLDYQLGNM
ncbi:hypothetical protein QJQ45_022995 [Haematococcus lacustris]|nr:hypothetical protein QJQ45_022995 [Haematococcus lacustris]